MLKAKSTKLVLASKNLFIYEFIDSEHPIVITPAKKKSFK